jgi:hypothetical protein
MIQNIQAPQGAVVVTKPKGVSPTVQLTETPEALAWLGALRASLAEELGSKSVQFMAPEKPYHSFLQTIELVLKKLETKQVVSLWDVNRELAAQSRYFDSTVFANACAQMFG